MKACLSPRNHNRVLLAKETEDAIVCDDGGLFVCVRENERRWPNAKPQKLAGVKSRLWLSWILLLPPKLDDRSASGGKRLYLWSSCEAGRHLSQDFLFLVPLIV
ncbi:hypothetical protein EYF80_051037 [Liparis tanakae]|uniref:Uncharacterized protein n=1 Tax=Liparis tanakae TaxID=230148 RepID=A0A4Z2FC19_9TELE|nr:hypothetical protein EYF80_051037 [Liparis tanakae]